MKLNVLIVVITALFMSFSAQAKLAGDRQGTRRVLGRRPPDWPHARVIQPPEAPRPAALPRQSLL